MGSLGLTIDAAVQRPTASCRTERVRGASRPLELPATLPWRCRGLLARRSDMPASDLHLCHRRRAVFTGQQRGTSCKQLLRAKRRDDHELVGVQMRWTDHHV